MSDITHPPREAAPLIRPLPKELITGDEPIRFGGRPRLPGHLDWPRLANGEPGHFFAEIDFNRLPRPPEMPDFPATGTLFIFLALQGDGLYGVEMGLLRYTAESVIGMPERDPPKDLADLRRDEMGILHEDGTTDEGRLLVRQVAEALPFMSERAINPLALNMAEAAGEFVNPWKKAHRTHEQELERVFREARPFPPHPDQFDWLVVEAARLPEDFTKYNWQFQPHYLDWEFIFDWSKEFYRLCFNLTLQHFREMRDAGNTQRLLPYFMRRTKKKRKAHNKRRFGHGRRPWFWTFENPRPVADDFDRQAKRWMALSRFETGMAPGHMVCAFIDMLVEIERQYLENERHRDETDDDTGYFRTRVGMLDHLVKGHDKHAGWTWVDAKKAFMVACANAHGRAEARFDALPQEERWDRRVIDSAFQPDDSPHRFTLGTMPIQMFGLGFEIQQAVTDHADDVLLFQIGDSFGLPLQIGPDGVLQLWISPEDLAAGRFDRVDITMDYT